MSKNKVFTLVFWDNQIGLIKNDQACELFNAQSVPENKLLRKYKIHTQNGIDYFVSEVNADYSLPQPASFSALKPALGELSAESYYLASRAFQILLWDQQHQFCGACGVETQPAASALERRCPNCFSIYYPRIAPSIIVRIQKGNEILMARSPHFPSGVYGLIAGFVEAGESLEAAVKREVYEEVKLEIDNIRYHSSQSWPFPNTLMIAFTADYKAGSIQIDQSELESAGWYQKDKLPGHPSYRYSIANQLIQDFIDT